MRIVAGTEQQWAEFTKTNSQDSYSQGIVDYADRWATLMEQRMAAGAALHEIAQETSREADTDGITGFMYGAAVNTLRRFWIHGTDLAKWHNRAYMSDANKADVAAEEGKTVNPAVISIG